MKRSHRLLPAWIILVICALATAACSDRVVSIEDEVPTDSPTGPGAIRVTILFEGTGFADLPVILRDPETGENLEVINTGNEGVALLENIAPGAYRVLLSVPSFWRPVDEPADSATIELSAGETIELTFRFVLG